MPRRRHATRRQLVAGAGAAIVLFVDEDGSGEWSPGDRILDHGRVRFRHPVSLDRDDQGILRTGDLRPYRRYSVEIEEGSIREPMLVPAFDSFSFVADPNRLKRIEVPFQPGGVLRGRVAREVGSELRGVAGILLEVVDEEGEVVATTRTFRDGSFYHHPLPPGHHTLRVTPRQAAGMGLTPESSEAAFEVEVKPGGDSVELDLVVEPVEDGR